MNILRRLPLLRLLVLCGVVVAVAGGATAIALALGSGPTPPPKPLAQAVHDALSAPPVQGVTARITLTNHLLEGANLASNGGEASQLSKSPLISGASGRLWIGSDGHGRLELQSEKGDTQILWGAHTAELYDASTNTLYRYTAPQKPGGQRDSGSQISGGFKITSSQAGTDRRGAVKLEFGSQTGSDQRKAPTVAEIEEGIEHAKKHASISGATPTDVAGQAAYTVRVSPRENGGLIAGGELSWDAVHGVPLRAAIYSTSGSAPVIELAATEISYGPVEGSTLEFTPPADAKVQDVSLPANHGASSGRSTPGGTDRGQAKPHVTVHGKGLGAIVLAESQAKPGAKTSGGGALEGLPKVGINGVQAAELQTALGTVLSFERGGVRYLLAGSVTPSAIESFARGL